VDSPSKDNRDKRKALQERRNALAKQMERHVKSVNDGQRAANTLYASIETSLALSKHERRGIGRKLQIQLIVRRRPDGSLLADSICIDMHQGNKGGGMAQRIARSTRLVWIVAIGLMIVTSTHAIASPGCSSLNGKLISPTPIAGSAYGGWFDKGDTITMSASGNIVISLFDGTTNSMIIPNTKQFTYVVPATTMDTLVILTTASGTTYNAVWSCKSVYSP
jgi:hypothetical protein